MPAHRRLLTPLSLLGAALASCGGSGEEPVQTHAFEGAPALPCGAAGCSVDEPVEPTPLACDGEEGPALFERRIAPLLDEDRPSSCNGCHFTGTDLRTFIRETPCEAMTCLIEQELVDLDAPEESLILTWIARGASDASALPPEVASEEYDAFLQWITWSAQCRDTICTPEQMICEGPPLDLGGVHVAPPGLLDCAWDDVRAECQGSTPRCDADDPRAVCRVDPDATGNLAPKPPPSRCEPDDPACDPCDPDQVAFGFIDRVFAWRGRCEHCHEPGSAINVGNPPKWLHEEDTLEGAHTTIANLTALGDLDAEHPLQSKLLLKPLALALGGVEHVGGDKLRGLDDPAYIDFTAWLEQYGACQTATATGD